MADIALLMKDEYEKIKNLNKDDKEGESLLVMVRRLAQLVPKKKMTMMSSNTEEDTSRLVSAITAEKLYGNAVTEGFFSC